MSSLAWIVLFAVAVWLILGVIVLARLSKKYPQGIDWPDPWGMDPMFLVIGLGWFLLWLFGWPLHAWLAPHLDRFVKHEPSEAARHQLGLKKRLGPGERVVTVTALTPKGYVEHGGQRVLAQAQQGHIATGQTVTVVGYYMKRVIVKGCEEQR